MLSHFKCWIYNMQVLSCFRARRRHISCLALLKNVNRTESCVWKRGNTDFLTKRTNGWCAKLAKLSLLTCLYHCLKYMEVLQFVNPSSLALQNSSILSFSIEKRLRDWLNSFSLIFLDTLESLRSYSSTFSLSLKTRNHYPVKFHPLCW